MKIIFVCLGNICRSPMAEVMFSSMIKEAGLDDKVTLDSAATSTYEIGNAPDPRTQKTLQKHGLDGSSLRARQLTRTDLKEADHVIVMDQNNLKDVTRLANDPELAKKVELAFSLTPGKENLSVDDPWYTDDFDKTFADLSEALPYWLERIKKEL